SRRATERLPARPPGRTVRRLAATLPGHPRGGVVERIRGVAATRVGMTAVPVVRLTGSPESTTPGDAWSPARSAQILVSDAPGKPRQLRGPASRVSVAQSRTVEAP